VRIVSRSGVLLKLVTAIFQFACQGVLSEQYGHCATLAHLEPDIILSLLNGEAFW
jgi:hypothetical protein